MELGVSHVQNLSSLTPIVDNIFDKYNKNLVPIRSLSDHDTDVPAFTPALERVKEQSHTPGSRKSTRKNFGKPARSFSDFYM